MHRNNVRRTGTRRRRRRRRRAPDLHLVIFFIGMTLVMFFGLRALDGVLNRTTARWEYRELRVLANVREVFYETEEGNRERYAALRNNLMQARGFGFGGEPPLHERTQTTIAAADLLEINPAFVGWITIDGTAVDYPVVRGVDNETYLSTTFRGTRNTSGAIFKDYRVKNAFESPLVVLYGNNVRDGTKFASLSNFLDGDFLDHNRGIQIITAQNEVHFYYVLGARITNAADRVYLLDFSSRAGVNEFFGQADGDDRFLVLSTFVGNRGERLIVYARLQAP